MALAGEGKIPVEIMRMAAEQALPLSPLEAAHAYGLLKQTLEKLALVGVITVDPKVQAQELTTSVGEEITRMIEEQKHLEARFEELVSAQHVLRNLPNKSKLRENQAELLQVAEALRQSTKQLCRNLKDNPNVAENMAKVATERQALQLLLSNTLGEIDVFNKITPVVESVLAEEAAEVEMKETIDRERTTTTTVKQLRNDLRDEKVDHEEKMREKKKTLLILKNDLKDVKMKTAVETRYESKDKAASNEHDRRLEHTTLGDMKKELALVRQQVEIERSVYAATADFMRKLAGRLQEQSIHWSQRHDDDLNNRDRDLEQLRQTHARDAAKLRDMEDKWKSELALRSERENRTQEERERDEMEALRQAIRTNAAVRIQSVWRGFLVRRGVAGGGSKKKKPAGKKGGKKKK